jgi:hypothetical protein
MKMMMDGDGYGESSSLLISFSFSFSSYPLRVHQHGLNGVVARVLCLLDITWEETGGRGKR